MSPSIGTLHVPEQRVIAESAHSFAVSLAAPLTEGHVACFPKRVCAKQTELTAGEFRDLYDLGARLAKVLTEHYKKTGVTYIVNDGFDGGKEVRHLSLNVTPRVEGDYDCDAFSDMLELNVVVREGLLETTQLDEFTPEFAERSQALKALLATRT